MAAGQGLSTLDRARCATLCGSLSEPSQLPDIAEPSFVLHWDFADDGSRKETLIKHGDHVIFAEPAFYEGYERFIEVAEILHNRYGTALRDLIPTAASKLYLCGDYSGSSRVVAAARERIFSISAKGDA